MHDERKIQRTSIAGTNPVVHTGLVIDGGTVAVQSKVGDTRVPKGQRPMVRGYSRDPAIHVEGPGDVVIHRKDSRGLELTQVFRLGRGSFLDFYSLPVVDE